jgi:catechol-2,3-dioxygenase
MRIEALTVFSKNIGAQEQFYSGKLSFPITTIDERSFQINIGSSELRFIERAGATPYHFAFTIPSNLEEECQDWLRRRIKILKFNDKEVVPFPDWNARAMYFYDSDKNIVEFISRRNLNFYSDKKFGTDCLIEVSEIGVATGNIKKVYDCLNGKLDLVIFDGNFDSFCAIGDERGLFITVDINKKRWFPSDDLIHISDFITTIETPNGVVEISYTNGELDVINKAPI